MDLKIYQFHGENHPSTAIILSNIGAVKYEQEDYKAAFEYYSNALIVYQKLNGSNHPSTADTLENIGLVKDKQGDFKAALDYYSKY